MVTSPGDRVPVHFANGRNTYPTDAAVFGLKVRHAPLNPGGRCGRCLSSRYRAIDFSQPSLWPTRRPYCSLTSAALSIARLSSDVSRLFRICFPPYENRTHHVPPRRKIPSADLSRFLRTPYCASTPVLNQARNEGHSSISTRTPSNFIPLSLNSLQLTAF